MTRSSDQHKQESFTDTYRFSASVADLTGVNENTMGEHSMINEHEQESLPADGGFSVEPADLTGGEIEGGPYREVILTLPPGGFCLWLAHLICGGAVEGAGKYFRRARAQRV
jgi:hypothetical protein